MTQDRKELSFYIDPTILEGLDGLSLKDAIQYFLKLLEESQAAGYHSTKLEFTHDRYHMGRYDGEDEAELILYGIRYENDKEYATRLKRSEAAKLAVAERKKREEAKKKVKERELYERLKLQFGDE